MDSLSERQLKKLDKVLKESKSKKKKKKLTTSKKALWLMVAWCLIIQIFTMFIILRTGDSNALSILAGASVAELIAVYKIYSDSSNEEKMKHMEMNYDPDYDINNGLEFGDI